MDAHRRPAHPSPAPRGIRRARLRDRGVRRGQRAPPWHEGQALLSGQDHFATLTHPARSTRSGGATVGAFRRRVPAARSGGRPSRTRRPRRPSRSTRPRPSGGAGRDPVDAIHALSTALTAREAVPRLHGDAVATACARRDPARAIGSERRGLFSPPLPATRHDRASRRSRSVSDARRGPWHSVWRRIGDARPHRTRRSWPSRRAPATDPADRP